MKKKIKLITIFFILCSLTTFSNEIIRKISVTGNIKREMPPDLATINFTSHVKNINSSAAVKEEAKKFKGFKKELARNSIKTKIETMRISTTKNIEYIRNTNKKDKTYVYDTIMKFSIKTLDSDLIPKTLKYIGDNGISNLKKDLQNNSIYYFNIGSRGTTKKDSYTKGLNIFKNIKNKFASIGISKNDITFEDYNITKRVYREKDKRKEIYAVNHKFSLILYNLKELNSTIAIAEKYGINIENYIDFSISNKEKVVSDLYKEAFNQANIKAKSILKNSNMKLGPPLVVSESVTFQQKAINEVDRNYALKKSRSNVSAEKEESSSKEDISQKVDYTPKPIVISQNLSVLFEIK